MQGLPKIALEVGAELPDLNQICDVVDLVPTFRMRAGGALVEASVSLYAVYGSEEIPVRADGMTPPVIIQAPGEGVRRPRCIRVDIPAQQEAAQKLSDLGLVPDQTGQMFTANGDRAIQFWSEGLGRLPEDWDLFVPEDLVGTQVRSAPVGVFAKVSSGMDWLNVKLSFEAEGAGVERDEIRRHRPGQEARAPRRRLNWCSITSQQMMIAIELTAAGRTALSFSHAGIQDFAAHAGSM
jgi:hypothetical protein